MTCQRCGGEGLEEYIEYHPYGSTVAGEHLMEPCPECFERGICPRCDEKDAFVSDETGEQCGHCGWRV
jgi:hypothetical protein